MAVKSLLFTSHSLDVAGDKTQGVLMEAALSKSISHPNVVATYSCDLKPVTADLTAAGGGGGSGGVGLQVSTKDKVFTDWRLYIIQVGGFRKAVFFF